MRPQRRFIGIWRPVSPSRRSQDRGGSASLAATASADAGELPCALLLIQHVSMHYMEEEGTISHGGASVSLMAMLSMMILRQSKGPSR
jgi:hypothetical protein